MPAFEKSEYRSRTAKLREEMSKRGMDALLVLNESNLNYLTGYEGFSDYVPQLALVTLEDEDPWVIFRELDTHCAAASCYLPESRVLSYPEKFVGSKDLSPWRPIADHVHSRVKSNRIGVELSAKSLHMKSYKALLDGFGVTSFIDGDGLVNRLKAVKSPAELAYIEQAGKIADRALLAGRLAITEGVRGCDVAAAVSHALCAGTPEFGGGASRVPSSMPVGSPSNAPHIKWTDERYKTGCQTNFEVGAFRHRYACAVSRTVFLGDPSDRSLHVHRACLDGFAAAFEAIRAGTTSNDVERAFRRAFEPYGVRKESRIGYSIGIDWVDGGPSFQAGDDTTLEENMTFHLLIGIFEKTDGYIFSESVRVTNQGAISLSSLPRDMMVNH